MSQNRYTLQYCRDKFKHQHLTCGHVIDSQTDRQISVSDLFSRTT